MKEIPTLEKLIQDLEIDKLCALLIVRHRKTMGEGHVPVIFCKNCGSTRIDSISSSEIQCFDCWNKTYLNGMNFGIRRNALEFHSESDVWQGIQATARKLLLAARKRS